MTSRARRASCYARSASRASPKASCTRNRTARSRGVESESGGLDAIRKTGESIGNPPVGQGERSGIKLVDTRRPLSRNPRQQAQATTNLKRAGGNSMTDLEAH